MRFIFFLDLLMASTVNGVNFTDTDGTAPITSIARKPEDEERFGAAGSVGQ
ncbi:hypothetical protein GQ600_8544 [Phytophthora cactorum]|nr:hypothetical protein GQ600_8544 [Phytophthora cactorum]